MGSKWFWRQYKCRGRQSSRETSTRLVSTCNNAEDDGQPKLANLSPYFCHPCAKRGSSMRKAACCPPEQSHGGLQDINANPIRWHYEEACIDHVGIKIAQPFAIWTLLEQVSIRNRSQDTKLERCWGLPCAARPAQQGTYKKRHMP